MSCPTVSTVLLSPAIRRARLDELLAIASYVNEQAGCACPPCPKELIFLRDAGQLLTFATSVECSPVVSVVRRIATASIAVCGFTCRKLSGNVAKALDVGAEILAIAFNQPRHLNRDRIAGVGGRQARSSLRPRGRLSSITPSNRSPLSPEPRGISTCS
jgi:hypothetical protein